MPSPDSWREIKLNEGKLIDRIKNYNQKDWMRACEKLGLDVRPNSGKGSHCGVYKDKDCPSSDSNCCILTIPHKILPNFQRDQVKKVLFYGLISQKFNENDIWVALKVKK